MDISFRLVRNNVCERNIMFCICDLQKVSEGTVMDELRWHLGEPQ